jgi:hypothetical protein
VMTQLQDYVAKTAAAYNVNRKCIMQYYYQWRRKMPYAHLIILPFSVLCIQPSIISSMRLMSSWVWPSFLLGLWPRIVSLMKNWESRSMEIWLPLYTTIHTA